MDNWKFFKFETKGAVQGKVWLTNGKERLESMKEMFNNSRRSLTDV